MQGHIVSEYSNQVHQLLVSVSKHLYFGSSGHALYQEKPMEATIKNCHKSRKDHLVYYILRDHFSGSFTFRIASSKRLIPLADFLYYAWNENASEEKFLWGMPDYLSIPQVITTDGLLAGLKTLNIAAFNPPSGFASGIRILRDIEDHLLFNMDQTVDHTLEGMNRLRFKVYKYLVNSSSRDNKFVKWQTGLPAGLHPKETPAYTDFISHFPSSPSADFSLLLVEHSEKKNGQNENTPVLSPPRFSLKKLNDAQQLIYDAWETPHRQKRLELARKALRISPYCADAYNLLAGESHLHEERQSLYEQGVKAGYMSLGDLYFKKNRGHFWANLETRPFMRSLAGLSKCLWRSGRRQEAIEHYQEILSLNPNDNQGIRYTLVNCFLSEGMEAEAEQLLNEYQESSCFMLYSETLLTYRRCGSVNADKYLKKALLANKHVPPLLLGIEYMPFALPDYYSWGSIEEAMIYVSEAHETWKKTPGALAWLAEVFQNMQ